MNETKRYSEAELTLFKIRIEQMIEKEKINLQFIIDQINDIGENSDHDGDWMDDSSVGADREMLNTMENRQRKHLWDLENALQRIRNKTYGICMITGEQIDKRRLMAVPTTTKCLAAKMVGITTPEQKKSNREKTNNVTKTKEIVSRIGANIKPAPVSPIVAKKVELDDDDDDDEEEGDLLDDELFEEVEIDTDDLDD